MEGLHEMNKTPRTEAVIKMAVGPMREYAIIEHAQTLERELLKAREERDEVRAELEMWRDGNILHEIHRDELEKVECERDQARRELDIQLESISFHMDRDPVKDHPLRADDAKLEMTQKGAND